MQASTAQVAQHLMAQQRGATRNPIGGIGYPPQDEIPAIKPVTAPTGLGVGGGQMGRGGGRRGQPSNAARLSARPSASAPDVPIEIPDSPPPAVGGDGGDISISVPGAFQGSPPGLLSDPGPPQPAPAEPDPILADLLARPVLEDVFSGVEALIADFDRRVTGESTWIDDVEEDVERPTNGGVVDTPTVPDIVEEESVNKLWMDVDPQAYVIEQLAVRMGMGKRRRAEGAERRAGTKDQKG
ncbi:hypothetical protein HDU93_005988 [Gonapodya sp. JEL0774]|nr:hypothetical protein HDU93_005988 [Gonapodya sp. JEL0774]